MTTPGPRRDRRLRTLIAATALCYAIGYPLALIGHSNIGWIFVGLGGPLLIALVVVVIRRVHGGEEARRRAGPTDTPSARPEG